MLGLRKIIVVLYVLLPSIPASSEGDQAKSPGHTLAQDIRRAQQKDGRKPGEITNAELDSIDHFFLTNPPNGHNAADRKKVFALVDELLDQCPREEWLLYYSSSQKPPFAQEKARLLERQGVPYLMRRRFERAIADISRRAVPKGSVAITFLYNSGFVIETTDACIGIDLCGPWLERLAGALDALFLSHSHSDHIHIPLILAMKACGKPTYAVRPQSWEGFAHLRGALTFLKPDQTVRVGPMQITAKIGDHYPPSFVKFNRGQVAVLTDDQLMPLVRTDTRDGQPSLTVYHTGDCFNAEKIIAGAQGTLIDVYLGRANISPQRWAAGQPNAKIWRDLNESVGDPQGTLLRLAPRFTIAAHLAELGHGKEPGGCMPFCDGFGLLSAFPEDRWAVLFWGERILIPTKPSGTLGPNSSI